MHFSIKCLGNDATCVLEYDRLLKVQQNVTSGYSTSPGNIFLSRSGGAISDDHLPFHEKGLGAILHLISPPFPYVWHTIEDTVDNLDFEVVEQFRDIFGR